MRALLSIWGSAEEYLPGLYLRVLGVRKSSIGLLSLLSKRSSLPVITQFSDLVRLNQAQRSLHDLDIFAAEIACLGSNTPANFDYASPLIIV